MRKLDFYYNFFTKICYTDKYEETEKDTESLYLALAEKNNCIIVQGVQKCRSEICYVVKVVTIRSLKTLAEIFSVLR